MRVIDARRTDVGARDSFFRAKQRRELAACNILASSGFAKNASNSRLRHLEEARTLSLGAMRAIFHPCKKIAVVWDSAA